MAGALAQGARRRGCRCHCHCHCHCPQRLTPGRAYPQGHCHSLLG